MRLPSVMFFLRKRERMAHIKRRQWKTKITYQVIIKRQGIKTIVKTFELKSEAKKWARKMEVKLDKGDYCDYTEARKLTLGSVVNQLVAA